MYTSIRAAAFAGIVFFDVIMIGVILHGISVVLNFGHTWGHDFLIALVFDYTYKLWRQIGRRMDSPEGVALLERHGIVKEDA